MTEKPSASRHISLLALPRSIPNLYVFQARRERSSKAHKAPCPAVLPVEQGGGRTLLPQREALRPPGSACQSWRDVALASHIGATPGSLPANRPQRTQAQVQ